MNKINELYDGIKEVIISTLFQKSALNRSLAGVVNNRMVYFDVNEKNAFKTNYTVNRAIKLLANSIAQLPVQIYRGDTLLEPDTVLNQGFNLKRPHPGTSLNKLIKESCIYYFLDGDLMIYIDLEAPFSLEVINPSKMKRQKNGSWKFNNSLIIPEEQLIHISNFNPGSTDGKGLSLIDVVKAELNADARALEYNSMFFKNSTNVGGTLISTNKDRPATKEQMQEATDTFNMRNASSSNAHKTIGLYGGIKYEQQPQTMRDMDFIKLGESVRDKVLAVFGIHKCLLGATDSVDRAVALEATRQLWNQTITPEVISLQEEFNTALFNRFFPGYHCVFDMTGIDALKQSIDLKMEQVKVYRLQGYTTNELNERFNLGMEDVSDPVGDMRLLPTSLIPADDYLMDNTQEPEEPQKGTDKTLDKVATLLLDDEKEAKTTHLAAKKSRATRSFVRNYDKTTRKSEKRIVSALNKYNSKQLGKVMAIVKRDESDLNTTLANIQNLISGEKVLLSNTMRPVYVEGSKDAHKLALSVVEPAKAVRDDYIEEVVEAMTNKIVGISNTTYKLIRNQVKESTEAGETLIKLATRIRSIYKFNSSRLRTIARTESNMLVSRTTDAVYRDKNVKKKIWINNVDEGTRDSHAANGSVGQVPYNHVYNNGQKFPGDGNGGAGENINCRCCFSAVVD